MNCDWTNDEQPDEHGKRRVRCVRCGLLLKRPISKPFSSIMSECLAWPRWHELGYWTELALASVGLRESRVNWMRYMLGLTGPCGCDRRKVALNAVGRLVSRWLTRPVPAQNRDGS